MRRNEWEFEYSAGALAIAAAAQRDFRITRIASWEAKKLEVMSKIRDSGLTVHEGIADKMSNVNKYQTVADVGAQILIDPTLQQDLNECTAKIREHTNLRKQYDAWCQVLSAQPESRHKLDHDDWMFFYGK